MTHRILVAEPSATLGTLIRLTLGPDGVDLRFVAEGRAALAEARRDPPDLLLIDAALPGLDGYAVVETLRSEAPTRELAVILTIADYLEPDLDRLRRAGGVEVLTKPFERHALRARVRAVLSRIPPRAPTPVSRSTPEAASAGTLPEAAGPEVARLVEQAVQRALPGVVRAELSALLDERLTEALAQIVSPHLAAAIDAAVARALPDVLETAAFGLSPKVEATLDAELHRVAGERAERVAWKVVPELAEQLIRDEIERLTRED